MTVAASLAEMPLYTNLDRVARGLAAEGIGPADPIPPERLFPLDQWHYHGTDAIRAAAERLRLGPGSHVLEIGSGIGGPARYLAHTTGCRVTAVELQPNLHEIAVDLTRRTGLTSRVTHVCGDALTCGLPEGAFDAVGAWLAIVHIPQRPRLLARMAAALRPGGGCHIEDLCQRAPFDAAGRRDLREVVVAATITPIDQYVTELREAGFGVVEATDLTSDWAPYAAERLAAWRANHDAYAKVSGEGAFVAQEHFYAVIARLYDSGSLGGVRLVANKT
jgi:cyclopropane fatty-acyl-phospholipid synthase-like methyltransferase